MEGHQFIMFKSFAEPLILLYLSLFLKVLTYPFILDNMKINGLTTLSKYSIKCLDLFCLLIEFEMLYYQH